MGKDRRAELAAKVGLKKAQFGAIGGGAKAAGDATSAYFQAEAAKEVARQATHQAAVGANKGILHELDGTFLDYKGEVGTAKKPATLNVQLSILSAYMLGVMAEKLWNDSIDATTTTYKTVTVQDFSVPADGVGPPVPTGSHTETVIDKVTRNKISEFANNALQIRAPLTALSGEYKLGPKGEAGDKEAAYKQFKDKLPEWMRGFWP